MNSVVCALLLIVLIVISINSHSMTYINDNNNDINRVTARFGLRQTLRNKKLSPIILGEFIYILFIQFYS